MTDTPNPDTKRALSRPPAVSIPPDRLDRLGTQAQRAVDACSGQAPPEVAELLRMVQELQSDQSALRDEWDEKSAQFAAPQRVDIHVRRADSDPPTSSERARKAWDRMPAKWRERAKWGALLLSLLGSNVASSELDWTAAIRALLGATHQEPAD